MSARAPRSALLRLLAGAFVLCLALAPAAAQDPPPIPDGVPTTEENVHWPTVNEVELGRKVAQLVEQEYELVAEGPAAERLARVGAALIKAVEDPAIAAEYRRVYDLPRANDRSLRVPFEFSFTAVKRRDGRPDVNAFSLAGGPMYVTVDLLEQAPSDDELAAVLAHEISHVVFHHVEQLVGRHARAQRSSFWVTLAAIIAGAAGGPQVAEAGAGIMIGSQLVGISRLTAYGRDLEREADRVGIMLLERTPFNPVGMLTFMRKLARDDLRRGSLDWGIFQTHPYPSERVELIQEELRRKEIPVTLGAERRVSRTFHVEAVEATWDDRPVGDVLLNGELLFRAASAGEYASPLERAWRVADQLDQLIHERDLTMRQTRLDSEGITLLALQREIFTVTPEDAAAVDATPAQAAEHALNALHTAFWRERVDGIRQPPASLLRYK